MRDTWTHVILFHSIPFTAEINTYDGRVDEMLRFTALLLPIDDIEVDFGWVTNGSISIRRDLNHQHILEGTVKMLDDETVVVGGVGRLSSS